jgi:hypothetical protein
LIEDVSGSERKKKCDKGRNIKVPVDSYGTNRLRQQVKKLYDVNAKSQNVSGGSVFYCFLIFFLVFCSVILYSIFRVKLWKTTAAGCLIPWGSLIVVHQQFTNNKQ